MYVSPLTDPHEARAEAPHSQSHAHQSKDKALVADQGGHHCQGVVDDVEEGPKKKLVFGLDFGSWGENEGENVGEILDCEGGRSDVGQL